MDEQKLPSSNSTHLDTGALDAAGNVPVSAYASPQNMYPVESIDVHQEGVVTSSKASGPAPHAPVFSRRKAAIISTGITLAVTLITSVSLLYLANHAPKPQAATETVKSQDVKLNNAAIAKLPSELQGNADSLLINGDIVTRGNLKLSSGNFVTVIKTEKLTANQSFTLPNATGTLCLDSNNCSFATAAQLAALQQQVNQLPKSTSIQSAAGVDKLNNQTGSVTVQGTANQVSVSTAGGVITLSTPQNLDVNANIQFGNLTLATGGTVRANNILQTAAGNNISINAGANNITFTANGDTFQFPAGGGPGQTICTTGVTCAAGGGLAVILHPASVQVDNAPEDSIFINDTGGGDLLHLQSLGVDKLTIDNSGNTTISSLGTGPVKASSGLLSTGAINLSGAEVTSTLSVGNGGTGANTLTANGVLVGNGVAAVSSVTAGAAGQCLISNVGAPSFQACPGSGGVTSLNTQTGVVTLTNAAGLTVGSSGAGNVNLAINYGAVANTAVQGNTTLTCPSGTGNLNGGGNSITLGTGGSCNSLDVIASPVFSGTLTVQGATTTIGTAALQGSVVLNDGNGQTATIKGGDLIASHTYTIPVTAANDNFCLVSLGNCAGSGTGVTASPNGTANRLPVFTAGQNIGDSYLLQSVGALTLDTSKDLVLAGGTSSFDMSTATGTFKTGSGAVSLNGDTSVTGSKTLTVGTGATILGGTLSVTGTSTLTGLVTANGGLSVGPGFQFTNNSSTLLGNSVMGNFPAGGSIGSAATTVDVKTTFNVNQTTVGQTLSLPSPTSLTVGRIVIVNNVGTASFTMHNVLLSASHAQTYIWNGTAWVASNIDGPDNAVTTIGAIDSQSKSANGASIASNTLYLQTADTSFPGYVSTGSQTFAGDKTFNNKLDVVNDTTLQSNLTVNAAGTVTFSALGAGLVQSSAGGVLSSGTVDRNSSTYFTGTLSIAKGGTNNTSFNANGLVVVNGAGNGLTTLDGSAPQDGYIVSYDNSTGTFKLVAANGGVSPCDFSTCAKKDLSNLGSVKINTSLLPDTAASVDLGGSGANQGFRDLYIYGADASKDSVKLTAASNTGGFIQTLDAKTGTVGLVQSAGSSTAQTGDFNVSGSLIAATAIQGTLIKSADSAVTTADITLRSGNTSGTAVNSGNVSIKSGNQTGTGNSGSISIDAGSISVGTAGSVSLATTNASGLTLGRTGLVVSIPGGLTTDAASTINGQTISSSAILTGTLTIQGANALKLGTASSNSGAIVFQNSSGSNTVTLKASNTNPGSSISLTLPSALPGATECLNLSNTGVIGTQSCSSGLGGSGTTGAIAKFTSSSAVGDSLLSESGTVVSILGTGNSLDIQGSLAVGKNGAGGSAGTIALRDGGSNAVTIGSQASLGSSYTVEFPVPGDTAGTCLILANVSGSIYKFTQSSCAAGGAGGNVNLTGSVNGRILRGTADGPNYTGAASLLYDNGTGTLGVNIAQQGDALLTVGSANAFKVTDAGAISASASITSSGLIQTSAANQALTLSGAPTNSATQSLVQIGNAIASGNTTANGGTYIGVNLPNSGAGSVADLINLQKNGVSKFLINNAGDVTGGKYNGLTLSQAANQFSVNGGTGTARTLTVTGDSTINQDLTTGSNTVQFGKISSLTTKLEVTQGGTGSDTSGAMAGATLLFNATTGKFQANRLTSTDNSIAYTFGDGTLNLQVSSCATCANVNLSNLGAIDIANSNRPTQNVAVNTSIGASLGVDLGASTTWVGATPTTTLSPFRSLYLYGATGSSQSANNLQITTEAITTPAKVLTLPNLTGYAAVLQNVSAGQGTAQSAGGANAELSISGGLAATYVQTANAAANTSSANLTIKTGSGNGTGSSGDLLLDVGAKGASGAIGSIKLGTGANMPTNIIFGQTAATTAGNVAIQTPGGITVANSLGSGNSSANLIGITAAATFDGNLLSLKTNATQEFRVDASGNTLAHGNMTVEGGALTLGTGAATSVTAGTGSLAVTSSNFNLSAAGVLTVAGAQTTDITTASSATANGITIQPGISSAVNGTAAALTLKAGDQSGTTCNSSNCTGGSITLQAGSATGGSGTTRNGGNVSIDAGTGNTANGTVSIGTSNALTVTVGRSLSTTTLQGNASTTLTAISGASSTQLAFVAPTATVIYQFDTAAAGTYKVCTTANTGSASACAPSAGSGNYIQNQFGPTQTANYNIQSANSGQVSAVIKGAASQSVDILQVATNSANVFTIGNTGLITVGGGLTKDITTADASSANGITLQPGVTTAANGSGAALTLKAGDESGTACSSANCTGGSVSIQGGSATGGAGTTRNGGNVSIDGGTGNAANGTVSIGTSNALTVTVGRAAGTTTLQGNASTTLTANSGANSTQVAFVTPTANVIYQFSTAAAGTYQICTNAGASGTSTCASAGGSGNYIQNGTSTQTANYAIQSAASGSVAAVIKGAAGQSVDILQVATSTTTVFSVGSAGLVTINGSSPTLRVGDTTNGFSFNDGVSNKLAYRGTARQDRTVILHPEFVGATLDGSGIGTLTSGICSGTSKRSINTSKCAASDEHNYYEWTTTQGSSQVYDIYVRYQLPSDFGPDTTNTTFSAYGWRTTSSDTIKASIFAVGDTTTPCANAVDLATSNTTWTSNSIGVSTCTFAANDTILIRFRMTVTQNNFARLGELTFAYKSVF